MYDDQLIWLVQSDGQLRRGTAGCVQFIAPNLVDSTVLLVLEARTQEHGLRISALNALCEISQYRYTRGLCSGPEDIEKSREVRRLQCFLQSVE
jgi:hypothetical protein